MQRGKVRTGCILSWLLQILVQIACFSAFSSASINELDCADIRAAVSVESMNSIAKATLGKERESSSVAEAAAEVQFMRILSTLASIFRWESCVRAENFRWTDLVQRI